jgi:hypothetical protein
LPCRTMRPDGPWLWKSADRERESHKVFVLGRVPAAVAFHGRASARRSKLIFPGLCTLLVVAAFPGLMATAGPLDGVAQVYYEQTPHGLVIRVNATIIGTAKSILIPNVTEDALDFDYVTPDIHIYWNAVDLEWDVYAPEEGSGLAVGNGGVIIEEDLGGDQYDSDFYAYNQALAYARLPHADKADSYADIKYMAPFEDPVDATVTERFAEADLHLVAINLRPQACGAELMVQYGSVVGYSLLSPTQWWVFEGIVPPQFNNGYWLGVKEYCV